MLFSIFSAPKFALKEPSIRDISQNIVHLTWTPAEIPDSAESISYMVEMQTPPGISTWSVLHRKHPSPSVRLADLRPDLDYLVRVRAQCGSYRSEPTHPVYIPRRAAPPRLPVEEPYAVDINSDYVKLQWRSADLPTHIQDYAPVTYRLEAQEFPDTNWVTIARGIPHTDFKVTGLNPQRDYNFRIRAENEYGLSDPTHPMLIRKRSDLSEDQYLIRAKETEATNSLVVASADEINMASSENESFLIENCQMVQHDGTGLIGNKNITGEINDISDSKMKEGVKELIDKENVKELQTNKVVEKEDEVSEQEISPQTAKTESAVIDLDKLDNVTFKESEQEVSEQQVIPEYLKKESEVPGIEKLCTVEKAMDVSIKTMQNNAYSNEVNEEYIIPESANKDKATPDIIEDKQLVEEIRAPKEGKSEPTVEVLSDDTNVQVTEGIPVKLRWKIRGIALSNVNIYKGGQKVETSGSIHVDISDDVISLIIDNVTITDEAVYSVRIQESERDYGEVRLKVDTSVSTEGKESAAPEEPQFVVEPVVDVEDGRRLSIKCSVTGFPAPEVTWYHHGKQLDQDALWDIYSKDGYNYLGVGDPSVLNCEEIVCRVENDLGYVQRVVRVKSDGEEVYCEPVLPPVSPEPSEVTESSPSIKIEISEIVTANLRKLPLANDYTDRLNFVTLNAGDVVEVLAYETEGTVLARNMPHKDKVCYIPVEVLTVSGDVSSQVCENAAIKNNTQLTEQQLYQNKEEATMPERRKMKSPSPKMTSTPKMKRKEMDTESTEELQKRLGFSDNLAQKKEFSTKDLVEFTEYNDGTTRPVFKKRLKSVTAKSGEMAQLECTVSGSPLPKILWLKNNRPLKACDGCKVIVDEGTNILVFPQAREEDVGIYTARAMNVNGSIMCSAEFTLSDGRGLPAQPVTDSPMDMDFTTPAYFFQMSSCEVAEGRLARFDCRVVAYPKPEIVWMRDGKVVEAEQRFKLLNFNNEIYSLLIQDVRIEDTGRYTCWARNKFGEAMTEAYLNVIALTEQEPEGDIAPKFLTRFYDQQTTEGTATDFKCLIAGRPEPSVTWLLDDLEIREEKGVKMRRKDGVVSLEIKSPKVDQSGTYTCQLNNPLGEATCSARLTVVEDKLHGKMLPKFLKKFDHVTVKEGEEARFTSVIVGEPRPDVTWLFDHKPISDTNRRFQVKKEGDAYTLIIKNVRFDDGGKITCKASNEEGEVYCSANLHVRESKYMRDMPEQTGVKGQDETDSKFGYIPTFTKRLQDLEVKEGAKATFECKVMGIPDPEISWMKDGRVISPSGRYHMTLQGGTGQLVIDNVTAADTGVYTCIVSNSQGKSSSTAALKLEEPKKERYTPDRLLEERTSRKERYTPDKYLLDDSTSAKRPYLDTDRYDKYDKYDAKVKKSYESPLASTKLEESYVPRSKKKYDSPKSSYDSFKPKFDTSYESPKLSYESPLKQYDSAYTRLESPVRQYDMYKRYESPIRQYEGVSTRYESPIRQYEGISTKYESPVRPYESISTRYESPVRQYEGISTKYESPVRPYEGISTRYESPVRMYDTPRSLYESPRRRSSVGREEKIKAIPKIPFDRPALLNKREDSVQLSWLPAPTYDLPDDARHISYVVESREVPSRDWTKVASSVPGTSYTVRHLRPDKEYEFRVRAQNQHGASEPTWNATLDKRVDETSKQLDLPEMRAPPRLPTHRPIITDLGEETLRLAWRPVETYQSKRTPPVSYRLEAKELPGKDWMPLSSRLRDTTHYLSELPHDRDYMIRVRAENDFGISEPTEPLWLPRATAFPGVPVTRPEIIDYEDTRAKLSWSRVDIPAFGMDDAPLLYMLEVEEPPHKDWRTIARDLDDTEYIVEGLRPGHDYRFRVRAKTPTGIVSEPSPAVSLYTKLAQTRAPVDRLEVLEYEPDTRSVNLSWDRVDIPPYNIDEEPLMYMLEYQEPPLPEWRTLITGIPTTRYRVMHLDRERDYNFRVRALTPYGVSPPSPALPVTMRQTPVQHSVPVARTEVWEEEPSSVRLRWHRAYIPRYYSSTPLSYR
ncbi:muscle M-line assembly protein unc-89-like [Mercenaria mercenaria]|uniref:muscle M-line assembly protein unc-89-like n=1 Tax=Mercenaria mercenaria TaxID=6596 RepID=UPI00234F3F2D|nr:muscle M-line assembly protein unc-89-like [Mercenaria mercenaria]